MGSLSAQKRIILVKVQGYLNLFYFLKGNFCLTKKRWSVLRQEHRGETWHTSKDEWQQGYPRYNNFSERENLDACIQRGDILKIFRVALPRMENKYLEERYIHQPKHNDGTVTPKDTYRPQRTVPTVWQERTWSKLTICREAEITSLHWNSTTFVQGNGKKERHGSEGPSWDDGPLRIQVGRLPRQAHCQGWQFAAWG